ncbi:hypothetical protein [Algoriphagus sp.]|uniref:hypothetical protein n=1 Tax=Algoriphagus sp. TaxID=1872435 RepID=UPI00260853B7|nr:hypothetical protein [Algoriphagus sp.]
MIRNRYYLRFVKLSFFLLLLGACQSEYQKIEERELASGKEVNELFLGLQLGMDRKGFYETCWDLNKEGILTNGPTELSVEYIPKLPSGNPARMRFYPKFEDEKIYLMPVEFTYDGWAPWNEELAVEKLRADVVSYFEELYGEGFFEVSNEDKSLIAFVKIDGNRRIRVFKKDLSTIRAEIVDLKVQKQLEKEAS